MRVIAAIMGLIVALSAAGDGTSRWVERFGAREPMRRDEGVAAGAIGALPAFTVTPRAPGTQLVRFSAPLPVGALPKGLRIKARSGEAEITPDLRVLTWHPGRPLSARRALITFPFEFVDTRPIRFELTLWNPGDEGVSTAPQASQRVLTSGGMRVILSPNAVEVFDDSGKAVWSASLIAPEQASGAPPALEVIEQGAYYAWGRLLVPDARWPRIIDVRLDSLGTVCVDAQVQRLEEGDATAPDLGWEISGLAPEQNISHRFTGGETVEVRTAGGRIVRFPRAHFERRGGVEAGGDGSAGRIRYLRCEASEGVPFQEAAWRSAAFVVEPEHGAPRTPLLEPELEIFINPEIYDNVYNMGLAPDLDRWPGLIELSEYTRAAIVRSVALGDDFGNLTGYTHGHEHGGYYGMNRLNHGPAVFHEYWRGGGRALREAALLWCINMYDLSIWWGDKEDFGGTRYNAIVATGDETHKGDTNFMWRSNWASNFCTKGYDAFFYAYEETGDPRMLAALDAQVAYAREHVHADRGECRNIGDVADFMNLYRCTGVTMYLDEALRLFRELRTKLSPGDLFSQGGQPIIEDGPFIDDDQHGYEAPFAKPYIIGYALAGLPWLLEELPDEPKLRDVVRAVADFQAGAQDPTGGWRYPHPRSSRVIISQGVEHAVQLSRAAKALEARGEDIAALLDAIERTLQGRVLGYLRTGTVLSGLEGWEQAAGILTNGKTIYDLYQKPADRDPARDYTEGEVGIGSAPPESLTHFFETLAFYLERRPAERLFHGNPQLEAVLGRTPEGRIRLIPQEKGSYLRMESPENPDAGFTLWAPEWLTFPKLGYSEEELGGMPIAWERDETTGAVWYTIERAEAAFSATFTPYPSFVECVYTVWPNPGAEVPPTWGFGPCQQMKPGIFEGDEPELLNRLYFLADGAWTSVASCASGNPRNVIFIKGLDSPEMTGAMAESGWRTIQAPRPDAPLIACVSRDGQWVAGTAAESSNSICNNAGASHRCVHSQAFGPLRKDGPTTIRVHVYLFKGDLEDLRARYVRDAGRWAGLPASPGRGLGRGDVYGARAKLPSYHEARIARLDFPAKWPVPGMSFPQWRAYARGVYLESLGKRPPLAAFEPRAVAEEDRGSYMARKIALNISADNRVLAYLLVPKGPGPFPAVIALHDHGAHFSIGKEKVVRPFGVSPERAQDAQQWVDQYYGGRYIGDELAKRGYVVFAMDALFWGDRGRAEGVEYSEQNALAANILQLGETWAGNIVWDDVRSAEFVQGLPEVAPERMACMGLSMGANRAWHLAAATDIVKAGAAICWMGDTRALMAEGNNQTTGQSAFSMTHPGQRNFLDFPHVASIACPKPMLFYNGTEDGLFPVDGVERCYAVLREVWESQGVSGRLETKLWPAPHLFSAAMQDEVFAWLAGHL